MHADLVALERAVIPDLGPVAGVALAEIVDDTVGLGTDLAAHHRALGDDPAFAAYAPRVVRAAAARARAVHTGEVPYVAEKAFTAAEALVVERALAAGLWRDEAWVDAGFDLLADVVVAPDPAARSVPSQAMCFAVARALRDAPTPEGVAALDAATRETRHAGIRKKFARYVRDARRDLAARSAVALRLVQEPSRRDVTAWTRTLQDGWALEPRWTGAAWRALAHRWEPVSRVAAALVWTAPGVGSFRGTPGAYVDADDRAVEVPDDAEVRLWHPAAAGRDEREAWRRHVVRHRLDQPFAQAFREHYAQEDAEGFSGHVVDLRQLGGVARAEGWRDADDGMERELAGVRAEVAVGGFYPGASGTSETGPVRLVPARASNESTPLPVVPVSELLRSVDLVVSTSAVALAPSDAGPGGSGGRSAGAPAGVLALRRTLLGHVLAELAPEQAARVQTASRHLVVDGRSRVHLTTGRVTRDGDAVEVEPRKKPGLWTPSADPLLARIIGLIAALLEPSVAD
ncbi:DUF4132 domain-containing protein [Nocardioides sp. ChNu-153]|uniref:DUF4132 domain-containing protein n=1 Tax=unclassified Nocardioides TaxID=2615069 RepID=UPI002407468F|nr:MULTISPECIES: DUF4132 domain-containing protein [unclassified Nocardioides]MDF9716661.1 DUF4132 domain-containing protein [Nocardioides sp. ChNu-99]MDN7123050.1 DUF4132 domain-containing protein [Nocardioides sp. ChNu-153]